MNMKMSSSSSSANRRRQRINDKCRLPKEVRVDESEIITHEVTDTAPVRNETDEYIYTCSNCNGKFKRQLSYLVHSTQDRPACAFSVNEKVTNLDDFILCNINTAIKERKTAD